MLGGAAQRRCALGDDAEPLEIVFCKKQIMWAGLNRDIRPLRTALERFHHTAAGADMHNVQLRTGLARDLDGATNRVDLRLDWPRP